eukprot:s616_g7.t3
MEVFQSGRGSTGANMYLQALGSLTSTTTKEYAHRRVAHKSAYVLSADVAGPFRVKGVSTETNQHRFMLVCAYQFPKLPGTPETQHESLDEDTGAGAGIGDLLFEEEGEDNREIAEEDVVDKREIVEGDGGAKVEDGGRPNPEEEAAKSFEPLEFSDAYFVRPSSWVSKSTRLRLDTRCVSSDIYGSCYFVQGRSGNLSVKAYCAYAISQACCRKQFELNELWGLVQHEDGRGCASIAAADQQAEVASTASKHVAGLKVAWVHAVARRAVVLFCLTQPVAGKKSKPDIEVNFAWELYGMVFLLAVAGITIWEVVKKIWSKLHPEESESREARRLRKLQSAVREELHGVGLGSQTTWASSSSSSQANPMRSPTYATGSEDPPFPPPPPPYPTGDSDDLPHLEELRGTLRRRRGRTTDHAVQTEPRRIQGEVTIQYTTPLFVTKNGKCIHARDTCSSLVVGGRTEQRFLCQLCNRG